MSSFVEWEELALTVLEGLEIIHVHFLASAMA